MYARAVIKLTPGALLAAVAPAAPAAPAAKTSIKHLVVIFQENHSFDGYFATYPKALNPPGQPAFRVRPGTHSVNGLTPTLIERNPNAAKPFRIDRLQSYTCDQDHEYSSELKARNGGLMDQFVRFDAQPPFNDRQFCAKTPAGQWYTVMGYFDGNTVTAYWTYAQYFAMSDNHFATMAGQSTRGALNLTSGDSYGVLCAPPTSVYGAVPECGGPVSSTARPAKTNGVIGTFTDDTDPYWDVRSQGPTAALTGRNIGDLLTTAGVTWGWFQGGFELDASGKCSSSTRWRRSIAQRESTRARTSSPSPTTCRITTRSSISPRPPTRKTCRRPRWRWWARPTRRSTCTTPSGSGKPRARAIRPRLPLLVISPYAKENYVSAALTDQTSILRFIEVNWLDGERISDISFDRIAGMLDDLFDFTRPVVRRVFLNPATGLRVPPRK